MQAASPSASVPVAMRGADHAHNERLAYVVGVPCGMRRDGTDVLIGGPDVGVDAIQVGVCVVTDHVLLTPHVRRRANLPADPLAVLAGLKKDDTKSSSTPTREWGHKQSKLKTHWGRVAIRRQPITCMLCIRMSGSDAGSRVGGRAPRPGWRP